MKKILIVLLLLICARAHAQDSLQTLNHTRDRIKLRGMEVLGSWAIANITVGSIAAANTTGPDKYFHQMNAIWNVANLGVAALGYINVRKAMVQMLNPTQSLNEQRKIENIFLVNGGLDLAYITGGILLKTHGYNTNSDRLKGYGNGVILQGAFLLLFDATMYSLEKNNGNKLRRFL